jgi:hypothetical protein
MPVPRPFGAGWYKLGPPYGIEDGKLCQTWARPRLGILARIRAALKAANGA